MKHIVVAVLLSATGLQAFASEEPEVPRPRKNIEEVVVTGYKWDFNEHKGALMMGLSGAYLIHEYDKKRDEWKFVRASTDRKKDS
ncbi:MAG: hypothetical protein DWQ49_02750 [Bacteroidetes bacterium]|nr:MAG: hypothetical protein DWQ49_02750 [Bacteroidota bacterium]